MDILQVLRLKTVGGTPGEMVSGKVIKVVSRASLCVRETLPNGDSLLEGFPGGGNCVRGNEERDVWYKPQEQMRFTCARSCCKDVVMW